MPQAKPLVLGGMMEDLGAIIAGIFVVLVILSPLALLFRRSPRIESPTLGLLDLSGGSAAAEISADRAAISQFFSTVYESSDKPPGCDVLFLYCRIQPDGSIPGSREGLREIIRYSGAKVGVIATENTSESYIPAMKETGYGHANIVMTHNRKGEAFPLFFQRLFSKMKKGVSMPAAWVKLAPQVPGQEHADAPETVFVCEVGPIAFR